MEGDNKRMIKIGFVFLLVLLFSISAILSAVVVSHSETINENKIDISKLEERIEKMELERGIEKIEQQLRKEDDLK